MTSTPHRKVQRTIAAHFSSGGSREAQQEMRLHLPLCAECLDYYQRHLLISELDPAAASAEDRLARGLGLPPRRRARSTPMWFGMGALAGAAAVLLFVFTAPMKRERPDSSNTEFTARGLPPTAPMPEIAVYRLPSKDARPELAGAIVSDRDELAFAYRNAGGTGGKGWLLIFAVDEHGHVYWYHPGWTDVGDDPAAVEISRSPGLHELPTAVAHKFDGQRVVLHALFTEHRMTVRQVEAAVRASLGSSGGAAVAMDPSEGILSIQGAVDVRRPFKVVR